MFLYLQNPEDISNIDRVSLYVLLAIEILTSRQLITYVSHLSKFGGANIPSNVRRLYIADLD